MRRNHQQSAVGTLLLVAVLSLMQPTGARGLDHLMIAGLPLSTYHNLFLLLTGALAAVTFGVRRWINPIIASAFLLLVLSFTLSTPVQHDQPFQNVRTFLALCLAPFLFELRLPRRVEGWLRRLLPWMALGNLALSFALFLFLERSFHRFQFGAFRLSGTVMPLGLSMLALVGLMFSLLAARRQPRWMWLGVINYGVVVWTGTRLTVLCGAILCFAWIVSEWLAPDARSKVKHRLVLAAVVPLFVLSYAPFMANRIGGFWGDKGNSEAVIFSLPSGEQGFDVNVGGGEASDDGVTSQEGETADDVSSGPKIQLTMTGRMAAWKHYFGLTEGVLWFGRGLAAGVAGSEGALARTFRLPHNEYLRLLVSGGIVGLGAMLVGYLWVFWELLRRARTRSARVLFIAAVAVLAIEALLTNALAAQPLMIPFWLYLSFLDGERHMEGHA